MAKHGLFPAFLLTMVFSKAVGPCDLSHTDVMATPAAFETDVADAETATSLAATARGATGTPSPTESETLAFAPSTTPTPSATPTPLNITFTVGDGHRLTLRPEDTPGFTFSKIITFGPGQQQGFKDWFGSATDAQPFIDAGLGYISMVGSISGPSPCTKVCFFVSSVMVYNNPLDIAKASSLMLDYELRLDKTNKALAPDEITALTKGLNLPGTLTVAGITGTAGTGQYTERTIGFYGTYSNVVLVVQAGGVPDAITPSDVFPFYLDMVEHALQAK